MASSRWDGEQIRARLTALGHEIRPALPLERVVAFEREFAVTLPESYRTFVTEVGNGGAGPFHGLWELERSYGPKDEAWRPGFLATPFPHTTAVGRDELGEDYDEDRVVTGSMILSDMGCGSFARLVVTGARPGQVWFDHLMVDDTLVPGPGFCDWYSSWLRSLHQ
ncbi:SMI1/KNR4 family protein [Nonomuraea sp. 3-1Str]|uniref:SMI1/KNR4 family protein n=1 Tax=Nonomuraea sp. 3-1Str TaxID=2929801 RepID=UPI0028657EE6|nr:SMI1/KNR4 family protein [Nonomuraea sp. 3-1Str]MDR8414064.1 SMI1/KNR4 family protein [Nonomuraea sp. 3-1Str]